MTHRFHLHKGIAVMAFAAATLTAVAGGAATTVYVANVEQLYDAVNAVNDVNVGATVVLAPGTYTLSPNDQFGAPRPHRGRLELKQDMSLYGVAGDRGAVVIDGNGLPSTSFTEDLPVSGQRTGVIRIGRGSNTIEWLTVLGKKEAAAGIETELGETSSTWIRVAHVVSDGSSRGVDVRNAGWANNAGRRIEAEIVDNEFVGPTEVQGMSEGIRLANFQRANGGFIVATLRGNSVHGFQIGCILANNRSSNASVQVRSSGDRFFANDLGCLIAGGLSQQATPVADSNSTVFEAFGSRFVDNTATISGIDDTGGILVVGGQAAIPDTTRHNTVTVSLWGCPVVDNINPVRIPPGIDFVAFGARSADPSGIAGLDNQVTIELHGVSKQIQVFGGDSMPDDPSGSNKVTVIRSPGAP